MTLVRADAAAPMLTWCTHSWYLTIDLFTKVQAGPTRQQRAYAESCIGYVLLDQTPPIPAN